MHQLKDNLPNSLHSINWTFILWYYISLFVNLIEITLWILQSVYESTIKSLHVSDQKEDELSTLKPPYERLPNSYHGIYPTSYYATHTYVPPIKIPSPDVTKAPIFDTLGE